MKTRFLFLMAVCFLAVTTAMAQITVKGQVDRTFIIAQSAKSLFLIDQHAAHERILYDKLVLSHGKVDVTPLLVPIYVDMEAEDVELMGKNREILLELGVDAEPGGEKVLRVKLYLNNSVNPKFIRKCTRNGTKILFVSK